MNELDTALRTALAPVSRAVSALTKALRALETHLHSEAGAQKERDERAEELATDVAEALDNLPAVIEKAVASGVAAALSDRPLSPVEKAREDLAVEVIRTPIGILSAMKRAPAAVWMWLAADRARAVLLLTTLGGALFQLADGAPLLATLGRALLGLAGAPTADAGGVP